MNTDLITLPSGHRCLFIHSPGAKAGSVQIWFRAGSALEDHENWGIAHFLEHMFFKGTPTRPGSQIASEIESFGGELNAFTSFDYTCYYINFPGPKLDQSVSILLDMVSHPQFDPQDIPAEREVVWEEYKRSQDNPNNYNFQMLQNICFTDKYAHPILGREDTIKNFSREQIVNFRGQHYNIENALLIVAGDLGDRKKLENIISQFPLPAGPVSNFPKFKLKSQETIAAHDKNVRQATVTMAIEAPPFFSPDTPAEDIALACLGQSETSPLYSKLVTESALATSVSASTMFFSDGGVHFIRFTCPPNNIPKVYNIFGTILENSFLKGFGMEEIERNKNQYASSKIYDKESLESFSFSLGHSFIQHKDLRADDIFLDRVKEASASQIHNGMREIIKRPWNITIQLPKGSDSKKYEKITKEFYLKFKKKISQDQKIPREKKIKKSEFDPSVILTELKKGVQFIYRHSDTTPTFVFHTFITGGLSNETHRNNGIYNQIAANLTKGYLAVDHTQLKEDLEKMSSDLGGFSGKNAYGLSLHGLSQFTAPLLKHFFGSLIFPNFPEKHLKLEVELSKRVLENQKEDPVKECFKQFQSIVFGKHPYALNPLGNHGSLNTLTSKAINKIHLQNLTKNKIVLTYCGNLPYNEILELISPYLDKIPPRVIAKRKKVKITPKLENFIHVPFKREQTHIFLGKKAYATNDPNNIYLKMLTAYLSGQSSDLFVEVRDRQGLCYAVQPVHFAALESGYWGIYIGTGNEKVTKALKAISDVLNDIASGKITRDEFNKIKNMIEGQEMMALQTIEDYAQFYSVPVLQDLGLDFSYGQNRKVLNANYENFQKFLKKWLKNEWIRVIVGSN